MRANPNPNDNGNSSRRAQFLLGQSIWRAEAPPEKRWSMAIREDEPADEASKGDSAFRPAPLLDEGEEDDESAKSRPDSPNDKPQRRWTRLGKRDELIEHATSDDADWRRVGVVCGAGLGKTTNLEWLEAAVNRQDQGRGKHLAIFLEIRDLPGKQDEILNRVVTTLENHVGKQHTLRFTAERMLLEGRVTWLLDSLDQADPNPSGEDVKALRELVAGRWSRCRVWVSGRPYAFRIARPVMETMDPLSPWQFLRIGQLDEPECRHLLEINRRPGAA